MRAWVRGWHGRNTCSNHSARDEGVGCVGWCGCQEEHEGVGVGWAHYFQQHFVTCITSHRPSVTLSAFSLSVPASGRFSQGGTRRGEAIPEEDNVDDLHVPAKDCSFTLK